MQFITFGILIALENNKEQKRADLFESISDHFREQGKTRKDTIKTGGAVLTQLVKSGFVTYSRGKGKGYYRITPLGIKARKIIADILKGRLNV